MINDLGGD
jgi:magnesium-transporting ATPase (P-type)